jgi:hypothetical protein
MTSYMKRLDLALAKAPGRSRVESFVREAHEALRVTLIKTKAHVCLVPLLPSLSPLHGYALEPSWSFSVTRQWEWAGVPCP